LNIVAGIELLSRNRGANAYQFGYQNIANSPDEKVFAFATAVCVFKELLSLERGAPTIDNGYN
jgi:hypothetical protein